MLLALGYTPYHSAVNERHPPLISVFIVLFVRARSRAVGTTAHKIDLGRKNLVSAEFLRSENALEPGKHHVAYLSAECAAHMRVRRKRCVVPLVGAAQVKTAYFAVLRVLRKHPENRRLAYARILRLNVFVQLGRRGVVGTFERLHYYPLLCGVPLFLHNSVRTRLCRPRAGPV